MVSVLGLNKDRLLLLCDRWQTSAQACTCCKKCH